MRISASGWLWFHNTLIFLLGLGVVRCTFGLLVSSPVMIKTKIVHVMNCIAFCAHVLALYEHFD